MAQDRRRESLDRGSRCHARPSAALSPNGTRPVHSSYSCCCGARAFTLAETLVALFIVGVALLLGLSLFWQYEIGMERLAAQQEALQALDNSHEALRSGLLPLRSGPLPGWGSSTAGMAVSLEVKPTSRADLMDVTLTVDYTVRGKPVRRTLQTEVYEP